MLWIQEHIDKSGADTNTNTDQSSNNEEVMLNALHGIKEENEEEDEGSRKRTDSRIEAQSRLEHSTLLRIGYNT
jgi:hypothetical protein